MVASPPKWTSDKLAEDAKFSADLFRKERLAFTDSWPTQYKQAKKQFEALFTKLDNLDPGAITKENLADIFRKNLGDPLRYLAGPPISKDDLQVIADVDSMAAGKLVKDPDSLLKIYGVIERVIDPHRFPWVTSGETPTKEQCEAALLASSVLLAGQRLATKRRNDAKKEQEAKVKEFLRGLGFSEVPAVAISTIVKGPQAMQYCAECSLGERKADVVVRLHDTRLLAIECKVSNSSTNSIKRLNNDAAVKAEYWIKQFGIAQVVPSAVLSGVFKVLNLEQSQKRGLSLFWSHDLEKLGSFIESTK
jgi:hypothetical protein